MINGRRQTQSAAATDRGENFVDTSSLPPMIAFDRIETLKDGATALYGSEAVAGVVNFITRSDFEGFDLQLDFQSVDEHPQEDSQISGLYGVGNDTTHFLAAFNILDRSPLTTNDRRLSGATDDLSQAGNPGSFLIPSLPGNPVYGLIWTGRIRQQLERCRRCPRAAAWATGRAGCGASRVRRSGLRKYRRTRSQSRAGLCANCAEPDRRYSYRSLSVRFR